MTKNEGFTKRISIKKIPNRIMEQINEIVTTLSIKIW